MTTRIHHNGITIGLLSLLAPALWTASPTPAFGQTAQSSPSALPPVVVNEPRQRQQAQTPRSSQRASTARAARRSAQSANTRATTSAGGRAGVQNASGAVGYVATNTIAGSKTATPLMETPRSISVITRKELDDRGVTSIPEAVRYTAGVTTGAFGYDPRFDQIYVRGFSTTTLGDFRDGLKQFPAGFTTFRTEPYQLASVEVLKGPASVLYGQTVPGGLIDRRSKLPTENAINEVSIQGGTYGRFQGAFDIGGAADPDKTLLYRVVGLGRGGDTNFQIADERLLLAPSLTWRPDERTRITLYGILQQDESDANVAALSRNGEVLKLRSSDPRYDYLKQKQAQGGVMLERELTDALTFRQHTRVGTIAADSRYLFGSFASPTSPIYDRAAAAVEDRQTSIQTDNSLEARFLTGAVAHRVLAGVNYDHNVWNFAFGSSAVNPAYALNVFNPVYGIDGPTPAYTSRSRSVQEQLGVYLQDQISVGNWRLSLSGRQDWADRTQTNALTNAVTGARNDSAFTYSAGLLYLFDNGIAPYVSYATSFQPVTQMAIDGGVLAPLEGEQIEAGVKYQPNPAVLLTASAYDLKQKNAPSLVGLVSGIAYYSSIGEVRVRGVELEARTRLTEQLDTILAYTVSDASITKTAVTSELNKVPALTPRYVASGWLNYTARGGPFEGFGGGVGVRYVGETWTTNANVARNDAYTLFDLAVRYDLGKIGPQFAGLTASVNANNIADKQVVVCNAGFCYLSQGRTVIGTMRYRW